MVASILGKDPCDPSFHYAVKPISVNGVLEADHWHQAWNCVENQLSFSQVILGV